MTAQTTGNSNIPGPPLYKTENGQPGKGYTRIPNEKTSSEQIKPEKITPTPEKYSLPDENTREPGSEIKERPAKKYENEIESARLGSTQQTAISQEPISLDLQVTATQEPAQTQVFQGTERVPKTSTEKTEPPAQTEKVSAPNTNQTSTIGKVSFLKAYAAELKQQIEKNKNNANYPLEEKQKELSELENLLKGE